MNAVGFTGRMLRVDLSQGSTRQETVPEGIMRQYLGGTGIGIKYLYDEVPPGVGWNDPENRLIIASGPLGATRVGGSGTYSVVTKGAMTEGAASTQANGFFAAFLRFAGFDGIILQGKSPRWCYLYIHDGVAEIKDAAHLKGKDTTETEAALKKELGGERNVSVISIGPAGEHLVRLAGIVGDTGHIAAHNGVGAVLGSKLVKAIAVKRGSSAIPVKDKERLSAAADKILKKLTSAPTGVHTHGTLGSKGKGQARLTTSTLPIKNYTTDFFPAGALIEADEFRSRYEIKWTPCWACSFKHCHLYTIKSGPNAGAVVEEPEYEQAAAWGPVIGQTEFEPMLILGDLADRLGMDANEASWIIAWVMECYEKGLITSKDTDGIEMTWGNAEATAAMLRKIAERSGIGNILAEGAMRASQKLAAQNSNLAIFTKKGNTPRSHDHRALWEMMLDTATSDVGLDEDAVLVLKPADLGMQPATGVASPEFVSTLVARARGRMPFIDSLGVCRFNVPPSTPPAELAEMISAVSGWDFTQEEVINAGRRMVNLLRAFNIRHGLKAELDWPSPRYGSAPLDGVFQGRSALPTWPQMLTGYYTNLGWDSQSGKPLPDTLKSLGLDNVVKDIW
ncbi:MAG: aldehyde ferredoxin oxidoreductase C-terminal domain-containing protein [Dehalococcoidales bacterium]|nr:aldehyde ferredoxin oxidoreductase C-terminal domain-containing protein [Dehalococcoidales bacterium]